MNDITTNTVNGLRGYTPEDDAKRGWKEETTDGGPIVYRNPRIGSVTIGLTPMDFDQPLLQVTPGVPVLGYQFKDDGELYFLALYARRFNIEGGDRLPEVSGGFVHVNIETGEKELPRSGALRELLEETGLDLNIVTPAYGNPFVADRALFYKGEGDGNTVYFFELGPGQIAHVDLQDNLEMIHWTDFTYQTADAITLAAIQRVMGALYTMGKLKVSKA
ncbi:NUDIX hydrolase [Patescibacteria group bacterium]|nr:MAG: NUDIX hydrolase [Patescibacteria group bacterium]